MSFRPTRHASVVTPRRRAPPRDGSKDWTEASVKSALYYDVHQLKGYGVRTELMTPRQVYDAGPRGPSVEAMLGTEQEHESIVPVYFLVLLAGMSNPLPHMRPR
jgi:hypothetical protein